MILLLAVVSLLLLAALLIGAALLSFLDAQNEPDAALLAPWLGLATIAAILLTVALFASVQVAVWTLLPVVLLAAIRDHALVREWLARAWALPTPVKISALILSATIFFLSSGPAGNFDTGFYHIQSIKWLREYGLVTGIGHLHHRLAQVTSWFALAAAVNTSTMQVLAATGISVFLLAVLHGLLAGARVLRGNAASADWFALFVLGGLIALRPDASHPSPDIPATFIPAIAAWWWLRSEHARPAVWLAAGALMIQLTMVPVALAAGIWAARKHGITTLLPIALALAILAAAGLKTSGCAYYPAAVTCVDSDGLGKGQAAAYRQHIWDEAAKPSAVAQDPRSWPVRHWPFTALIGLSLAATVSLRATGSPRESAISIAGLAGIAYTLINAPSARFGVPFAILAPAAAVATLLRPVPLPRWRAGFLPAAAGLVALYLGLTSTVLNVRSARSLQQLLNWSEISLAAPPPPPAPARPRTTAAGFGYYGAVEENKCWNAPLPCTGALTTPDLELRVPERGLGAGFRRSVQPRSTP